MNDRVRRHYDDGYSGLGLFALGTGQFRYLSADRGDIRIVGCNAGLRDTEWWFSELVSAFLSK